MGIDIPFHGDSPEDLAYKRQVIRRILEHASKLPPAKAEIFGELLEDLETEDIAKRSGISSGTARKRIFDLREKLRSLIGEKNPTDVKKKPQQSRWSP